MIITNTQLHNATPANTAYRTQEALEDEDDIVWFAENVEGNEDVLFIGIDTDYLITLHDRIRYHTACALSSFTHKVLQENPDAPYLTQAPSDDPVMMEFIDAMEETIRLECALGFMDPWQDTIDPWN
jgi:hypothetical protein